MKKFSACIIAVLFILTAGFSVEVAEKEIKSVGNQTVVFENYTGPHSKVDTLEQIKSIGNSLGLSVKKSPESQNTAGSQSKYYVIHAIDPNEKEKLDADILVLGQDAGVDHIRNLRHIIASYLSSAYNYSESDAETIATFVTVYNAVYRGKMDVFNERYKSIVVNNLTGEKAGLSTSYKDWPGKSQIVIPVSDIDGGLSTVDTSVISDKKVVSSMQEDDDKNIQDRKQMVDIKEREAENAQTKADEAKKEASREEEKLKQEEKKLDDKRKETKAAEEKAEDTKKKADEAKAKSDEAKKKAEENPEDKKAQENAAAAEKEAEKAKFEAEEAQEQAEKARDEEKNQEQEVSEQKEKTKEAEAKADEAQSKADKKTEEAQSERKEIAKDQQKVAAEEKKNESVPSAYGITLVNGSQLSEIVKMNSKTGSVIKESPVKVIRNRTVFEGGDGFIAVAGENKGKGAVKLVSIDKDSLEIVSESEEILSDESVLVKDGANYYCVIQEGSSFFVGKFSDSLSLVKKSPVKVHKATPIVVTGADLMVTDASNKPALLSASDLTKISE